MKQGDDMNTDKMRVEIEESLQQFWDDRAINVDMDSESIDDFIDEIDSLTAVDAIIDIERITGMEIPEGEVIRRGGYDTKKQFIEHLTASVLKYVKGQTT
jgi:acyl carrier protein